MLQSELYDSVLKSNEWHKDVILNKLHKSSHPFQKVQETASSAYDIKKRKDRDKDPDYKNEFRKSRKDKKDKISHSKSYILLNF